MSNTAVLVGVCPGFCEELAYTLGEAGYSIGMFA